jgi:hypothetical protein
MATANCKASKPEASLTRLSPSQQIDNALRDTEVPGSGGGGDGVGGGDDRTENAADAPVESCVRFLRLPKQ